MYALIETFERVRVLCKAVKVFPQKRAKYSQAEVLPEHGRPAGKERGQCSRSGRKESD